MTAHYDVLIIGAGHAGAQTAINLRQMGFEGSIALIGDEIYLPYERPPLSKEYLTGERDFERMLLRPETFWDERDIALLLGKRVSAVDPIAHHVTLSDDRQITYTKLVWAAGGCPRTLECQGAGARNIFAIRRRSDVDALCASLADAQHISIIGAGYIGLEAASAMRKLNKTVTVLEAMPRVLSRVAGPIISDYFATLHRAKGVDLRCDIMVEKFITDENGKATSLVLNDATLLPTDLVIVGIGIIPGVGPLIAQGATGGNGVDVDAYCRTTLDDIYAVGDCAAHMNRYSGNAHIRVESVQNANDQAKTVAAHIVGNKQIYDALPWFWSNQYDVKLQTVGLSLGYDEEIIRGDMESGKFSVIYRQLGEVIALDCINNTKDYAQGRKLIRSGDKLDAGQLANPQIPLKEVGLA